MKNKLVFITIIFISVIFISGCDLNMKKVTCTRNVSTSDSLASASLNYDIYYSGDYVLKTVSTEKITSTSSEVLKQYRESYEEAFKQYKNIKYYDSTVSINGSTLTSKIIIDYRKVDYKKIIEIEGETGNIFDEKGKVKLDTLIALYEKSGSECDR